jgi:hypothetical protein
MPNKENLIGKGFDKHPEHINKKGQPRSFKTLFNELKDEDRKELIDVLVKKGKKGDLRAIEDIIDRIDGKVKQDIEHSGGITLHFDTDDKQA